MTPQEILDRCLREAASDFKPGSKEDMLLHSLVLRFKVAMERMSPPARRTPAATTGDGELPPHGSVIGYGSPVDKFPELPEPQHERQSQAKTDAFTAEQMFDYARAAIEADRAQRQAAPASAQPADPQILKGIGKTNGDGWKDVTRIGEVVFVWNTEMPRPYKAGQFPRIGNQSGWTASTAQYDFAPASAEEAREAVEALLSAGAQPDQRDSAAVPCDLIVAKVRVVGGGIGFTDVRESILKRLDGAPLYAKSSDVLAASPAAQPVAKDEQ